MRLPCGGHREGGTEDGSTLRDSSCVSACCTWGILPGWGGYPIVVDVSPTQMGRGTPAPAHGVHWLVGPFAKKKKPAKQINDDQVVGSIPPTS